jgi:hypothetical protein
MPVTAYGFDVLEVEPSFDDPSTQYTRNIFRHDPRSGKVKVVDRSGVAVVNPQRFRWVMEGRTQIQEYRDFLTARKGQCVPFWFPTWRFDLPIVSDITVGSTLLVISRIGYTKFVFGPNAREYVRLVDANGNFYYRKILTATDGTPTETLGLDATMSTLIPATRPVSFLTLCRLATDEPELLWHNTNLAEATLDFVELPQEVP